MGLDCVHNPAKGGSGLNKENTMRFLAKPLGDRTRAPNAYGIIGGVLPAIISAL